MAENSRPQRPVASHDTTPALTVQRPSLLAEEDLWATAEASMQVLFESRGMAEVESLAGLLGRVRSCEEEDGLVEKALRVTASGEVVVTVGRRAQKPPKLCVWERLPGIGHFVEVPAAVRPGQDVGEWVVDFTRDRRRRYEVRTSDAETVGWVERAFEGGGPEEEEWVVPRGTHNNAGSLAVGPDGAIYVAGPTGVVVYEASGAQRGVLLERTELSSIMNNDIWGVAVREDGAVCVLDSAARRVVLFRAGVEVARTGVLGQLFVEPARLCVLPNGDWLVSDVRAARVVRLGAEDLAWRGVFARVPYQPYGLMCAPDGTVLCFLRVDAVAVYDAEGTLVREVHIEAEMRMSRWDISFIHSRLLGTATGACGPVVILLIERSLCVAPLYATEWTIAAAQVLREDMSGARSAVVDAAGRMLVLTEGGVLVL